MHLHLLLVKSAYYIYSGGTVHLNGPDDLNIDILHSQRGYLAFDNVNLTDFSVEKDSHKTIYNFLLTFFTDQLNYCQKKINIKNLLKWQINLKTEQSKIIKRSVKNYEFFKNIDDVIFIKKIFSNFYLLPDRQKENLLMNIFRKDFIEQYDQEYKNMISRIFIEAYNKLNLIFQIDIEFELFFEEKIILTQFFIKTLQIIELFFTENSNRLLFLGKRTISLSTICRDCHVFINHLLAHRDEYDFRCNFYKTVENRFLSPYNINKIPFTPAIAEMMSNSLVRTELFYLENEELAEKKIISRLRQMALSENVILEKRIDYLKFKITAYNLDKEVGAIAKRISELDIFTVLLKRLSIYFSNSDLYYLPAFIDFYLSVDSELIVKYAEKKKEVVQSLHLLLNLSKKLRFAKKIEDIENCNIAQLKGFKFIITAQPLYLENNNLPEKLSDPYFLKKDDLEILNSKFLERYNMVKAEMNIFKWEKVSIESLDDLIFNLRTIYELKDRWKKYKNFI